MGIITTENDRARRAEIRLRGNRVRMEDTVAGAVAPDEGLDGTLVLRLAYDGRGFSGFAEQKDDVRTVAGDLRVALETFLRRDVDVTCAGRTDAGVHALRQHVSVPATAEELLLPRYRLMRALGALLPDDISINGIYRADKGFSARFDALSRSYVYRIATGESRPLFLRDFAWWVRGGLDVDAMEQAAPALVGEHDFKSFCKVASAVGKPTCRRVISVGFERERELGEEVLAFRITGNAFLHSMVRTIVGSLVEVGRGHRDPSWLAQALAACDRRAAGPTAPALGLAFEDVAYPAGALRAWE